MYCLGCESYPQKDLYVYNIDTCSGITIYYYSRIKKVCDRHIPQCSICNRHEAYVLIDEYPMCFKCFKITNENKRLIHCGTCNKYHHI